MAADDYCYVTTTGRHSRLAHRIEIWYATYGTSLYLLAGGGRSADWVQNLFVDPSVLVELDGEVRRGRGRIIEEEDEASRVRMLVYGKYSHRSRDDLTTWRERALPVAIDLSDVGQG